jgi:hypothetical protein
MNNCAANNIEALAWLQENSNNNLGRAFTNNSSIEFIKMIYQVGADAVIAMNIIQDNDQIERLSNLIIMLPDDMSKRADIFKWYNQLVRSRGWATIDDRDQSYLFLLLE